MHSIRRHRWLWSLLVVFLPCTGACVVWAVGNARLPVHGYTVVNTYPHDPQAFCQGLVFEDGVLYEGTGQYGESTLRKVDLETGRVLKYVRLHRRLFGEGITIWDDKLIQLTWKSGYAFVYDKDSLSFQRRYRYAGEGWGITHDGTHLIMSDGSARLRFLDPETFRVTRRLRVTARGRPVENLNELEYVEGEILANVWGEDHIARIDPADGTVMGWIDLSGLRKPRPFDKDAVLNGIAYDKRRQRLYVTGKDWPQLFEIRVVGRE